MKVTIKGQKELEDKLKEYISNRERALLRRVSYIGEKATAEQRIIGNWTDRTSALRNSIAYSVSFDGIRMSESIPYGLGSSAASDVLTSAEKSIKSGRGILLIACAGMPYAGIVSARGYNVMDTATLRIEQEFKKIIKK